MTVKSALVTGNTVTRTLTGLELADFEAACRLLPIGKRLSEVVEEWSRAKTILEELPLVEAAKEYRRRHAEGLPAVRVTDAASQFISDKESVRCSDRYLDDLRSRLKSFAEDFQCNFAVVTKETLRSL